MTKPAHCGRQIHMTAQALRAVRYTALEQNGITFDLWVAMEVLAETPGIDREKLIGRPAELRAHDHANAAKAIHELHDQGCSTRTIRTRSSFRPGGMSWPTTSSQPDTSCVFSSMAASRTRILPPQIGFSTRSGSGP